METIQPPTTLPSPHRAFIDQALTRFSADPRIIGVAAAGSYASDSMDEFSDVDLVIAVNPEDHPAVMAERGRIAGSLGELLVSFTGEHVGEPRLLICLYDGAPPLHVDLKYVALPDAAARVDEPVVLWERDGRLSAVLRGGAAAYPQPEPQWIEDRFWVWIHYTAGKIGRGELFEALDAVGFLRARVLGPLGLKLQGKRPAGVRHLESAAPVLAEALKATVATHDARSLTAATRACVAVYRRLRADARAAGVTSQTSAEGAAMDYLAEIESRFL